MLMLGQDDRKRCFLLHVHLACVRLSSDVHAISVSSVEDPEKMLEQTVNEMQTDLIKMRQASAQVRQAPAIRLYGSNDKKLNCNAIILLSH